MNEFWSLDKDSTGTVSRQAATESPRDRRQAIAPYPEGAYPVCLGRTALSGWSDMAGWFAPNTRSSMASVVHVRPSSTHAHAF